MSEEVRCLVCGKGHLRAAKAEEKMYGISLGTYQGEVCEQCGETFLKDVEVDRAEARAKELGLWALERRVPQLPDRS